MTTTAELKDQFDKFKGSMWKTVSIVVLIVGITITSVQSCGAYYVKKNDARIEKNIVAIEDVKSKTYQNAISLEGVMQNVQGMRDLLNRMDEANKINDVAHTKKLDRIEGKIDTL